MAIKKWIDGNVALGIIGLPPPQWLYRAAAVRSGNAGPERSGGRQARRRAHRPQAAPAFGSRPSTKAAGSNTRRFGASPRPT